MTTLGISYANFTRGKNSNGEFPLVITLLENPKSPIALGGSISLRNHDYLHILLGCGVTNDEEAYVIGFTMGNATDVKRWHYKVFSFASQYLYPKLYRFTKENMVYFWQGVRYGERMVTKDLAKLNFSNYNNCTVLQARMELLEESYEYRCEDRRVRGRRASSNS